MSVKLKINLLLLVIGIISSLSIAAFSYFEARNRVYEEAFKKAELIHSFALAAKNYTKNTMRPLARKIAGMDSFRPELMSGFFVARSVGDIFSKGQPGYSFKAATDNPIKPENMADDQERELLYSFQKNRNLKIKKGIIKKLDRDYFYIAKPSVAKKGCIRCHGKREDAPKEQLQMYTGSLGYNYTLDKVVAIFITYVPIQKAIDEARNVGIKMALAGVITILCIMATVWFFIGSVVTRPIIRLTQKADQISKGKGLDKEIKASSVDEIGVLYDSFNRMRKSVVKLIKMVREKKG